VEEIVEHCNVRGGHILVVFCLFDTKEKSEHAANVVFANGDAIFAGAFY
jgi:hypothetical protein